MWMDLPPERLLHEPHAIDDVGERLLGERERPEILDVAAAVTAPAKMVGDDGGLDTIHQRAQGPEIRPVERVRGPDGE